MEISATHLAAMLELFAKFEIVVSIWMISQLLFREINIGFVESPGVPGSIHTNRLNTS